MPRSKKDAKILNVKLARNPGSQRQWLQRRYLASFSAYILKSQRRIASFSTLPKMKTSKHFALKGWQIPWL